MPNPAKMEAALRNHQKDFGHRFADLVKYLLATGRTERTAGSHHIYSKTGYPLLLNIQKEKDGKAKGYQIKQIRLYLEWADTMGKKEEENKK